MPRNPRKSLPELIAYHHEKAAYARERAAMWFERAAKSENRAYRLRAKLPAVSVEAAEVSA